MTRVILILLFTAYLTAHAIAQTLQVQPADEAAEDPSFLTYRTALLDAVVRRDVGAIVTMVDPEIQLSFGGIDEFEELKIFLETDVGNLTEKEKTKVLKFREEYWAALETTLRLGGRFGDDAMTFSAPYIWSFELPESIDPLDAYFTIGSGVLLRDRPIRYGTVIGRLNHDVVVLRDQVAGTSYTKVEKADGTIGYVHEDYLRPYLDYRAVFEKSDGSWKMAIFIVGD